MKRTALPRSSRLERKTPLRARSRKRKPEVFVGKFTGKIRLSGLALERLRERRYEMDGGKCQYRQNGKKCDHIELEHTKGLKSEEL